MKKKYTLSILLSFLFLLHSIRIIFAQDSTSSNNGFGISTSLTKHHRNIDGIYEVYPSIFYRFGYKKNSYYYTSLGFGTFMLYQEPLLSTIQFSLEKHYRFYKTGIISGLGLIGVNAYRAYCEEVHLPLVVGGAYYVSKHSSFEIRVKPVVYSLLSCNRSVLFLFFIESYSVEASLSYHF